MSYLSSFSQECASSELDLFAVPPTQTSIEDVSIVEYSPLAKNPDGPLEFQVPGSTDTYIDASQIYLYLVCQVVDSSGNALTQGFQCAPVNNLLHSIFSQVDVALNNKVITSTENTYPYRAYFETLLNYGDDAKGTHLQASMFVKDDANEFENIDNAVSTTVLTVNNGFVKRREKISKGEFDLFGRPHLDICFQDKFIIDNVNVNFKFTKAKNEFCLMCKDSEKFAIKIIDSLLYVRHCKISNAVKLAQAMALEKASLKYPIKRVEVKNFAITKGFKSAKIENVVSGRLPTRIAFGLVENDSFNGKYSKNPFNFKHFDLTEIEVYVNSTHIPNSPIKVDFDKHLYTRAYYSVFSGTNKAPLDFGNGISMKEYMGGYTMLAFDLSPDMCSGDHLNLQKSGILKIDFKFSKNLPENLMCVIYLEFENIIEISKSRKVIHDFTI